MRFLIFLLALFAFAWGQDSAPQKLDFSEAELETLHKNEEKHQFQAEMSRLMDIIINSLYSNREIFLRELISNSADALDKIRYLALTDPKALAENDKLEIRVSFDRDAKTITIRDTGIGMTKEQLIQNLGVVAKSGTTEFLQAATKGADTLSLIGQFGVGFYSVYLVADRVTVISKHNDDDQYVWQSAADTTFSITKDPRGNTLGRGTAVILHLKEDAQEFVNEHELEKIVTRYSEFIDFPIYLQISKTSEREVEVEEEEAEDKKEGDEEVSVSEEEEEGEKKKKTKTVRETTYEWKRLNDVKAIWTRNPKEITETEYSDFYKSLTKDDNGEMAHIHFTAEGEISFKSILYIPKKAPHNLYDKFYEKFTGLRLYVRRVLISDTFDDFLPRYFNFIRGVVDSDDLPLNVSRETLAQNKILRVMAKKITRKVLEMLVKLAEESKKAQEKQVEGDEEAPEDKYTSFWNQYGKSIKLGVIDDRSNRVKLSKLLRFQSSKSEGKLTSLEEYVDRMKEGQKHIYFITGESIESVKNSPFLEKLNKKGFEVLFMVDPLDEYLVQSLTEFDGHHLQNVAKEGLKIDGDKSEERLKKLKEEYQGLTQWLKGIYGDKVEKVTVSNRIAESPCVLVTSQYGWSANMERIMRAQTFGSAEEATWMHAKKTMEINPYHPLIQQLKKKVAENPDEKALTDLATLLYDAASVTSGFTIREPRDFASRIYRVVSDAVGVDPNAKIEEEPEIEEEPVESEAEATESTESSHSDEL